MNSKNKEALWKQILDRLTVTKDDRALFAGESVLPLTCLLYTSDAADD